MAWASWKVAKATSEGVEMGVEMGIEGLEWTFGRAVGQFGKIFEAGYRG